MKSTISCIFIALLLTVITGALTACFPEAANVVTPTKTMVISEAPPETTKPALFLRSRAETIPVGAVKNLPEDDIYPPVLHSALYEHPIPWPGPVNTAGAEDSPFMLPDGKTFYFFFTPDTDVPPEKQLFDGATGVYRTIKQTDGQWSEPERIVLNDDIALDGAQYVNGDTMWFGSARPGYTGIQLFTAELIDGVWQNWRYAGGQFPAGYEVGELHFTNDWTELYYHSPRVGGKGDYDIWVTRFAGGKWQEPENITAVNTPDKEGWPYLPPDGNELWFTRIYLGSPAIFRSVKVNGIWGEPELVVSQFAGEPTLDAQGNLYFTHHYYKDGKMLEADIYVAYKK